MRSIFLSASFPSRESAYFERCDPVLIQSALSSCLHTVLGNKHLVFGGHPSITPLVLTACETLGVQEDGVVTIFQSLFFKRHFPKENSRFAIVLNSPDLGDREHSLALMRQ